MTDEGRFTRLTREHGIKVLYSSPCTPMEIGRAVARVVGSENIISSGQMGRGWVFFLATVEQARLAVQTGIALNGVLETVVPLSQPAKMVTVSNTPCFLSDAVIMAELSKHGRFVSPLRRLRAPGMKEELKHSVGLQRQCMMVLKNGSAPLEYSFPVCVADFHYTLRVSSANPTCYKCKQEGHFIKFCPNLNTANRPEAPAAGAPGSATASAPDATASAPEGATTSPPNAAASAPEGAATTPPVTAASAPKNATTSPPILPPALPGVLLPAPPMLPPVLPTMPLPAGATASTDANPKTALIYSSTEKEEVQGDGDKGESNERTGVTEPQRVAAATAVATEAGSNREINVEETTNPRNMKEGKGDEVEQKTNNKEEMSDEPKTSGEVTVKETANPRNMKVGEGGEDAQRICDNKEMPEEPTNSDSSMVQVTAEWETARRSRKKRRSAQPVEVEAKTGRMEDSLQTTEHNSDSEEEECMTIDDTDLSLTPRTDAQVYSAAALKTFLQHTKGMRNVQVHQHFPDLPGFYNSARYAMKEEVSTLTVQEVFRLRKLMIKIKKTLPP